MSPLFMGLIGQKFDTRFISSVSLLDGALPAQYGLWTGGIFDIKTKQGPELEGGDASIYGGSYDTVRANFSYGGSSTNIDYFFQGGYLIGSQATSPPMKRGYKTRLRPRHPQSRMG
jgi:hypothetical protein